jgi:hypothetical protein
MRYECGSYTGNGTSQSPTHSIGAAPNLLVIKSTAATRECVWRSGDYYDTDTHAFWYSYSHTDAITAVGTTSFTVGANVAVNNASEVYFWFALYDDGNGDIEFGKYTGDGVGPDTVTLATGGFGTPAAVWVMSDTYQDQGWRVSTNTSGYGMGFNDEGETVDAIETFGSGTFTVDGRCNASVEYLYVAFKAVTDKIVAGSYTGDGGTTQAITTASGVTCEFAMLQAVPTSGGDCFFRVEQSGPVGHGDPECGSFHEDQNFVDTLRSFGSGTFTVGDGTAEGGDWVINRSARVYRHFWFVDNPVSAVVEPRPMLMGAGY